MMDEQLARKVARTKQILADAAKCAPVGLASSLSAEDQVLTDMIAREKLGIEVFTLNTGRLHEETVALIEKGMRHWGIEIKVYEPEPEAVQNYVTRFGKNAFYDSVDLRKSCCFIRKVEPLNRALKGKLAWVTGQRREQSVTRTVLREQEHDSERNIEKFNPLADWTWDDVLAYAAEFDVPLNPLHARGYPSIGCEPCTRAIRPGEDPRAGRWWWEQADKKECGLHPGMAPDAVI
jgi:phosphoadenosine phosphosulfate reductase